MAQKRELWPNKLFPLRKINALWDLVFLWDFCDNNKKIKIKLALLRSV